MNIVLMILIALIVYVAVDFVWITLIATNFYKSQLGHIVIDTPKLVPVLIYYAVYVYGLVFFVIEPAISEGVVFGRLLSLSATYGLVTAGAFNLLNAATIKKWPTFITIVNILGGVFMGMLVSVSTYFIYGLFF